MARTSSISTEAGSAAFPWSSDYVDLSTRFLSDEEMEWVTAQDPTLPRRSEQGCPTCGGSRSFVWEDRQVPCDCDRQILLAKFYTLANIGPRFQRLRWDDYAGDPKAMEIVHRYLENHQDYVRSGFGIVFLGPLGTGKTMLVSLMGKELVKLGYRVFFCTFSEMIYMFTNTWSGRESDRERFESHILGSDVLILDDVGREFRTSNNLPVSTFDHILRKRAVGMRPTILTSNQTTKELQIGYGAAIISLLIEQSVKWEMSGDDWRPQAHNRNHVEIKLHWQRAIF
jgi:DNA replication protein DnaC